MMEVESNMAEKFDPISDLPDDLLDARVIPEVRIIMLLIWLSRVNLQCPMNII